MLPKLFLATQIEDFAQRLQLPLPDTHPDVIWLNHDQTGVTIDLVRTLPSRVAYRPTQRAMLTIVLWSLDQATAEAQHALLKMLEEPPEYVEFVLTATVPSVLLPTILSRVQQAADTNQVSQAASSKFIRATLQDRRELLANTIKAGTFRQDLLHWLTDCVHQLETAPSLDLIRSVQTLQKAHQFLTANTNEGLVGEWVLGEIHGQQTPKT